MKTPVFYDVEQNTEEWATLRTGVLTASVMHQIVTPTLKIADNEKTKMLAYQIAAERLSGIKEEVSIGFNAIRGHADEVLAREKYQDAYDVELRNGGFITRDFGGFNVGYSPDGLGLIENMAIECKSRAHKYHVQCVTSGEVPPEHYLQVQTGLIVADLDYMHYISYSGGLPLFVIVCDIEEKAKQAILTASEQFEEKVLQIMQKFGEKIKEQKHIINTEYINYKEMEILK